MSTASQQANVELLAQLTGLTHDIFVGKVQNNVRRESKTAMLFEDAQPGEYKFSGQKTKFATDLHFKNSAMATSGNIPDYVPMDAVQGEIIPIRRYDRIALDNLVQILARGEGAFDDLTDRIFDHLWASWKTMDIRHWVGASSGLLAKISSRTSSTVVVLKDGYGHAGTNPSMHLDVGARLGWYDVSESRVGGAARVASINKQTNTVTLDSATTWEPDAGYTVAADDLVYIATTNDKSKSHFELERGLAPNGIGTIIDPDGVASTVHGISETSHPAWKPFRKQSVTFDHLELTAFWNMLASKRGFPVTPETDVILAHPVIQEQLARSLMGFQQQAYTGGELSGGYSGVRVRGIPLAEDPFFYHDVAATVCKAQLRRVNAGGDPDFWQGDGSMWSRFPDYDGKHAFVPEYVNAFSPFRGAHGALTGITTDFTASDFDAVPNH